VLFPAGNVRILSFFLSQTALMDSFEERIELLGDLFAGNWYSPFLFSCWALPSLV